MVLRANTGPASDYDAAPEDHKRSIHTVYEKIFNEHAIPRKGEFFPVFGKTSDQVPPQTLYHLFTEEVCRVAHELRTDLYGSDTQRIAVVTIRHIDDIGMIRLERLDPWAEEEIERICSHRCAVHMALVLSGYTPLKGPSLKDPLANGLADRIGGLTA